MEEKVYTGRKTIYTEAKEINALNIIEEINKAMIVHSVNSSEINYLYNYYKGNQPVLNREKKYKTSSNNKVLINTANEIVTFKTGYLMGEPVQYTARNSNENISNDILKLNDFCYAESKDTKDIELANWFHICGTAYRIVLIDTVEDDSPFEVYTLDPRATFVVYSNQIEKEPMLGITYTVDIDNGNIIYNCYTKNQYYKVVNNVITEISDHYYGQVPIIEYPANSAKLGAFEIVLQLLDARNETASNRVDGVSNFVEAMLAFKGVDFDEESLKQLKEWGAISIPAEGDLKYITQELNQTQVQMLMDDMYSTILSICGMPNRNGGSSTSDTGAAVIMRDGWADAEARAKDSERMFKASEKSFLSLVLKICKQKNAMSLRVMDVDITFTRRYYENNLQKSQVLLNLLSNDNVHPLTAFTHSGLFVDPEAQYRMGKQYKEQNKETAENDKEIHNEVRPNQQVGFGNVDTEQNEGADT